MTTSRTCRHLASSSLGPLALAIVALGAAACGESGGALELEITGEGTAKSGLPSDHDHDHARPRPQPSYRAGGGEFADGWELHFDKFLVSFGEVELRSGNQVAFSDPAQYVIDLRRDDPYDFAEFEDLPAQRWDDFRFNSRAPASSATILGAARAGDVEAMRQAGANWWIEGHAHKGSLDVDFVLAVDAPVEYSNCTNGFDGKPGLVIRAGAITKGEITGHLEHMAFADLTVDKQDLRWDAYAAAAVDGVVTFEGLASQSLADLRGLDGGPLVDDAGNPVVYNPGSTGATNLQQFLREAMRTALHLNEDGLCTAKPL